MSLKTRTGSPICVIPNIVSLQGVLFCTYILCVSSSIAPGESLNNMHRHAFHDFVDKTRTDIAMRGGDVINTIRRQQSRLNIPESLHHISDNLQAKVRVPSLRESLSAPFRSAVQCSNQLLLPLPERGGSTSVFSKKKRNNSGFYYGIRDDVFFPDKEKEEDLEKEDDGGNNVGNNKGPRTLSTPRQVEKDEEISGSLTDRMLGETLLELREMREDIYALREEMQYMKEEFKRQKNLSSSYQYQDEDESGEIVDEIDSYQSPMQRVARQREFENIGNTVEKWAHKLLFEEDGEEDGWREVKCNKIVRKKFNSRGQTTCYMKWMKDCRKNSSTADDGNNQYACIKVFTTIDSPMEDVCEYLSREDHMEEYNDLVVDHKDLEVITPHSKICWSQCPQILFIKPRDFVTFCHHRWRKDGTQIVVSEACDHKDAPAVTEESDDKVCRAYSLRGANFISKDPTDPMKTRMAILAHADPGGGIPQWATKTAINAVAPIEPFKLFHRIDKRVAHYIENRPPQQDRIDFVHSTQGRSPRPAGLSQLGYCCFWPSGGGKVGHVEPVSSSTGEIITSGDEFTNSEKAES